MMNAILGSALGGVAAGVIALMASAQGRNAPVPVPPTAASGAAPYATAIADTRDVSTGATLAPTLVECAPSQEATLQRAVVDGRQVAYVTCVSRPAVSQAYVLPARYGYAPPLTAQPDIVEQPVRTQSVQSRATRVQRIAQRDDAPRRSWKKTALVIGGSAGAGAGVGALAGGKKGALIGAAIGGGAASIYEAVKRK